MLGLIDRIRGIWVLLWAVVSFGYGYLILRVLPFWDRMAAVEGGRELQERFHYSAEEAGAALTALSTSAREEALIFYALDVPNALLYGASIGALIAFGLRQIRRSSGLWRWAIALPLLSAGADLVENALLATALVTAPTEPGLLGNAAGIATAIKF